MSSIKFVMLNDHKYLDKLLKAIIDGFGMSKSEMKRSFEYFSAKLEQHFIVEEQAIFSFSHLGSDANQSIIRGLLAEHGEMRGYMLSFKDKIGDKDLNISPFVNILRDHQNKENDVLYEKLDKELKENEKDYIINKIESLK